MQKIKLFMLGSIILLPAVGMAAPISTNLNVSTLGPGVGVSIGLNDAISMTIAGNYLSGINFDYQHGPLTKFHNKVTLASAQALGNYFPIADSSFHISGGALWNDNHLNGSLEQNASDGSFNLNGDHYTSSQLME